MQDERVWWTITINSVENKDVFKAEWMTGRNITAVSRSATQELVKLNSQVWCTFLKDSQFKNYGKTKFAKRREKSDNYLCE